MLAPSPGGLAPPPTGNPGSAPAMVRNHAIQDGAIRNGHVKLKILIVTENQSLMSDNKQVRVYTLLKDDYQEVQRVHNRETFEQKY